VILEPGNDIGIKAQSQLLLDRAKKTPRRAPR